MKISDKSMRLIYIINGIFILAMIIIWFIPSLLFSEEMEFEANMFQSYMIIITAGIATINLCYLAKRYKLPTTLGKMWFLLGLGMLGWVIGEIIYTYYENFTDIEPFPSIADLFYLLAYIPLSVGFIIQMRVLKITLPNRDKLFVFISFLIICIIVMISVIILPIQEVSPIPEDEIFAYFVGALYPIFDLFLMLCIFVVFAKLRHGEINIAWLFLLLGFLLTVFADIIFNWVEVVGGEPATFELYDLLYLIGYVLIYIGAFKVINIMTKTFE
ncbi:MAG: hypothetical protein EU532_06860 [Promethearchaeota archaeon]|nr:MAG: hypothetical protein EU532_06860 [Candidatus Lokiarchaeota archaeon]